MPSRICTARLTPRPRLTEDRYADHRKPFPGIPHHHEPVIEATYDPHLLSLTNPAIVHLPPALTNPPSHPQLPTIPATTLSSLLLVNKQTHSELTHHLSTTTNHPNLHPSLFLSFPAGLHVLTTLAPTLVRQTRSIHLAGIYTSGNFDASHAVCLPLSQRLPPAPYAQKHNANFTPNTAAELGALITSIFGPEPRYPGVAKLELRIYYPGSSSYNAVWGDDDSPTCVALRSIFAGEVGIEIWRGQRGTGVYLSASRMPVEGTGEAQPKKRHVSTVWRRLEEGRRGEPACGSWVVDPKWPEWEARHRFDGGAGAVVSGEVSAVAEA